MTDPQLVKLRKATMGTAFCRSCGAPITWYRTLATGRPMPIDGHNPELLDGDADYVVAHADQTHWATCPDAKTWRRGKEQP